MTIKRRDAALARISAGVDQPPGAPDVREKIERILTDFRLSHSCVEGAEDESCRLLDALTPPGQTIAVGREEIELLADHLVYELFGPDVVGTTEASVCLAPGRAGRLEGSEAPESRNTQHPLPQATPDGGNRHATLVTHGDPIAAGVNPDQPEAVVLRNGDTMEFVSTNNDAGLTISDVKVTRAADQQSVTCPRCSGVGTNYSSNYVGGSATCLLCAGHGKVIPRGDGSYQRMNADKPSAKGQD
jgi:hypothetical protein